LAKKHHPDTNKEDPDAEKKFQEIQQAYEVWIKVNFHMVSRQL
jgi:curved DNA-binding protein CbpA